MDYEFKVVVDLQGIIKNQHLMLISLVVCVFLYAFPTCFKSRVIVT